MSWSGGNSGGGGWGNPVVGGTVLRVPAIQSPNFVSGSAGWAINADGSAQFNNITLPSGQGISVFVQGTQPSSTHVGDIWVNTSQNNSLYVFESGSWQQQQFGTQAIASGAITAALIAANTITAAQIASGTITSTQIASATITASNIASGTITATQIAANTITASQLAAGIVYAGIVDSTTINAATFTGSVFQGTEFILNASGLFFYQN